jgi:hypothetical protein
MLMSAPPALMFPMPEHGEPSAFVHGGGGGGSAFAAGARATAAAPANSTGIGREIFAIMILVYHQKDERDNSAVDGTVAAFVDYVFGCWTTG